MVTELTDAARVLAERYQAAAGIEQRLFVCPSCAVEVVAIALTAAHRCPAAGLRWVTFERVVVEED